jgi:branched-chain amino acid aminotransferase
MSIHRYFLHNGRIREATEASLFAGQLGLLSGWGVFSTLRVVDGALFAWERHWARMLRDGRLLNVTMPADAIGVERDLIRLIGSNRAPNCTLRLVVVRNGGGLWEGPGSELPSDTIALTADTKQWGETVRLGVQPHARYAAGEFTGAKILSWATNLR